MFCFIHLFLLLTTLSIARIQAASDGNSTLLQVLNEDQSEAKRLEALHALEKTGGIDARQILRSICDTSAAIRAEAVRLGTRMAALDPELELRLVALANDRTSIVQIQMLQSLPQFPSARAAAAFDRLLTAALNSKNAELRSLAESLKKNQKDPGTR